MTGISLHDHTVSGSHTVIFQYALQVWHICSGIFRENHHFSAGFHVGNDLLCFFFREIFLRRCDQQASGIFRNRILCQQIQALYIVICFLQTVGQAAVQLQFFMTFQRVDHRQILGSHIRDRTVDLTFPVKSCRIGLIGRIIHLCFVQIAVADDFTLVPGNHNQAVIGHIIARILRSKVRI